MPRLPTAPTLVAALLVATPSLLTAQRIAPPCSSSVWNVGSSAAAADSTRRNLGSEGWTPSTGAAAGGVVGVLAGMAVGLWRCSHLAPLAGRRCGREVPRGAALFGGLGLLLGAIAGAGAERHGE
jgi:hypothetical protein